MSTVLGVTQVLNVYNSRELLEENVPGDWEGKAGAYFRVHHTYPPWLGETERNGVSAVYIYSNSHLLFTLCFHVYFDGI